MATWVSGVRGVAHRMRGVSHSVPHVCLLECGAVLRADRLQPERADARRCAHCVRGRRTQGTYNPQVQDYYAMVGDGQ